MLQLAKAFVAQQVADSGGMLKEHGGGDSKMKLPCSSIEPLSLHSRDSAPNKFPSPMVFYRKRFIVEDQGCFSIIIENNTMWASGMRLEFYQRTCWLFMDGEFKIFL